MTAITTGPSAVSTRRVLTSVSTSAPSFADLAVERQVPGAQNRLDAARGALDLVRRDPAIGLQGHELVVFVAKELQGALVSPDDRPVSAMRDDGVKRGVDERAEEAGLLARRQPLGYFAREAQRVVVDFGGDGRSSSS